MDVLVTESGLIEAARERGIDEAVARDAVPHIINGVANLTRQALSTIGSVGDIEPPT